MDSKYILYVNTDCPFCNKASALLRKNNQKFSVLNLKNRPKVLKELKEIYEWKTVPMVFYRQGNRVEFIGGYDDLNTRLKNV